MGGFVDVTAPVYRVEVMMTLSDLRRYPVKSCRGESVDDAVVEPWGLAGDRRWMLVDDSGVAITARQVNATVLLRAQITATGLRLSVPGGREGDALSTDVAFPDASVQVPVSVFSSHLTAAPADRATSTWVSGVLGVSARLVWLDEPSRRPTDPTFSDPDDRVSFADGYPLLLASESSLAALAPDGKTPPSMTRFRPNVVVRGAAAWAEDDWRRIRIGKATFRAVKGCARCVLTTVDPETAERGKEPLATLARLRRYDNKTWFGVNLVPDDAGATRPRIAVGDEVEVLESVEPGAGPLRRTSPQSTSPG